jgi:hypothetical protein
MSDASTPAQDTTQSRSETSQQTPPAATTEPQAAPGEPQSSAPLETAEDSSAVVGEKTEASTTEAKPVPEKYELKLPENSPLSPKALEEIALIAKEQGLTQKQAEALVTRESAAMSALLKTQVEELQVKSQKWVDELKVDKELGGEAFQKNVEMASRVVGRFGSDQLKTILDQSGFGNHPELVRVFSRIGKAMSEDQLVQPGASAQSKSGRSMEDIFYGKK